MSKGLADVLDKIRKLLELKKSPNEHEAALAAARAAELMFRYHLTQEDVDSDPSAGIDERVLETSTKAIHWRGQIASGLCKATGCSLARRDYRGRETKVELVVVGREADFQAVRYLHAYLCSEVERLADGALALRESQGATIKSTRSYKHSFRVGAAQAIYDRLSGERERQKDAVRAEGDGQALIRIDQLDKAVQDYADARYKKAPVTSVVSSGLGVHDGLVAGEKVDLGKGKTQLQAGAPRLPPKGEP